MTESPAPKVLVTGAGGFLGSYIVNAAEAAGWHVRAMLRTPPPSTPAPPDQREVLIGDLTDPASLDRACDGMTAVIHCAAATSERPIALAEARRINVEGTRTLIDAARRHDALRWIQISSMSAHAGSTSAYGRSKFEADEILRASGLRWTILRPSLIHGPGPRGLVARTTAAMRRLPVLPVIGGRCLVRPILARDVAAIAAAALARTDLYGRDVMLGGPDEATLRDFLSRLAAAHGLRRPILPIPIPAALALARILAGLMRSPPLTVDNVLGIREARRVDLSAMHEAGFTATGLAESLRSTNQ